MSFKNAMQATQKSVLQYAQQGRPYEVLAAVLAAREFNTTIIETDLQAEEGKKRQLKVNYYAPVCTDEGTGEESICNTGTVVAPKQVFFEISKKTASAVYQLNRDDIRYVDGAYTFSDHAKAAINAALPAVRRKLAVEVAALLTANTGLLPDGTTKRMLPFLDKTNGSINPMGLWEIERIYRDSGFTDPFIVGGTDVFHWRKAVEVGGLNDNGANISSMGRSNAYYDSLVNDAFGDDTTEHIVTFDPQMLKFVSFNRNAGIFATDLQNIDAIDAIYQRGGTDYIEGTLADPATGLLWDLNVNYDKCNYRWTFQWKLEWDIFFSSVIIFKPTQVTATSVYGLYGNNAGTTNGRGISLAYDTRISQSVTNAVISLVYNGVAGQFVISNKYNNSPATPDNKSIVFSLLNINAITASKSKLYINGGMVQANNTGIDIPSTANAPTSFALGTVGSNNVRMKGNIYEFILYGHEITEAQRISLRDNQNVRYKIYQP